MSEAPKKIWVEEKASVFIVGKIDPPKSIWVNTHKGDLQYIRADLVNELIEALEKGDYKPYCDCEECKKTRETLKALEVDDVRETPGD